MTRSSRTARFISWLGIERFANHQWFGFVVAVLAALDAFVFFVPNEALLATAVLVRPKHWAWTALWVSIGSAVGAAVFGFLASQFGEKFVGFVFPKLVDSKEWIESVRVIQQHGFWGLTVVSFSPLPQHAAVAIAGIAHLSVRGIFLAVLLGRSLKYFIVAWCALHSPRLLRKLRILPKEQ